MGKQRYPCRRVQSTLKHESPAKKSAFYDVMVFYFAHDDEMKITTQSLIDTQDHIQ